MEAALATLILALACGGLVRTVGERVRRRRLNGSLHELRRPAQLLALLACREQLDRSALRGCLDQLALGLEGLDREINGGPEQSFEPVSIAAIAADAERRWGWSDRVEVEVGEEAVAEASAPRVAAAIDNLVVNSLEHGRGKVRIRAGREGDGIALAVSDEGPREAPSAERSSRGRVGWLADRGSGSDPRRGHGSKVVGRAIAEHGGYLELAPRGHPVGAFLPLERRS